MSGELSYFPLPHAPVSTTTNQTMTSLKGVPLGRRGRKTVKLRSFL